MRKLGYEIIPVFFKTPFFPETRAVETARANGFEIEVIDICAAHLDMLHHPVYGFGKNFNPCIDCHGLMFKTAGNLLDSYQAHFMISGEVLSQRPMSQRKDAIGAVGKLSGYKELLIRPLSQQLLPDTLPIEAGWVQKDQMLALNGRSRKPQMALAAELGVISYPSPAGGCLLTDVNFTIRLRELLQHQELLADDLHLLRHGRHFRLSPQTKLIIGRDENDNQHLLDLNIADLYLIVKDYPGPIGIVKSQALTLAELHLAAELMAYYNKKAPTDCEVYYHPDREITQEFTHPSDAEYKIAKVTKPDFAFVKQYMISGD
jgi:hypothetical protein